MRTDAPAAFPPYPAYVHRLTAPEHLRIAAGTLGLASAAPVGGSVLELGCAAGANLMAMAARAPSGRFLGLDHDPDSVSEARASARAAGLRNVEFVQADLAAWRPSERFDHVIAHGVFSWTPDAVKDSLFRVAAEALMPAGVAYVSYLTHPGCKLSEGLREILRLSDEGAQHTPAPVRSARAFALLDRLDRAWSAMEPAPFAADWRRAAAVIRRKAADHILHDELGPEWDAAYLVQVVSWASEHGLRYLGDADPAVAATLALLPPAAREAVLEGARDALHAEQLADFVVNRMFRQSLFVGPEAKVAPVEPDALLRGASARLRMTWAPDEGDGVFRMPEGAVMTIANPALAAWLRELGARPGRRAPLASLPPAEPERLLELWRRRALDLWAGDWTAGAAPPRHPALSPLNLALGRRRGVLCTATHEPVRLSDAQRAFVLRLDGSLDRDRVLLTPEGRALGAAAASLLAELSGLGCLAA